MVMVTVMVTAMATETVPEMVTVMVMDREMDPETEPETALETDPETDRVTGLVMGQVVGLVVRVIWDLLWSGILVVYSVWSMLLPSPTSTLLFTMDLLPPVIFKDTVASAATSIRSHQAQVPLLTKLIVLVPSGNNACSASRKKTTEFAEPITICEEIDAPTKWILANVKPVSATVSLLKLWKLPLSTLRLPMVRQNNIALDPSQVVTEDLEIQSAVHHLKVF